MTHLPDPFLLDSEALAALADPARVRAGLRACNEHRVTSLDRAGDQCWAEVEDADGEKLAVELVFDPADGLRHGCECDEDPAGGLCSHAIAALFAYAKEQQEPVPLADAARAALAERLTKARAEVRVQPLTAAAERDGVGLWSARSLQTSGPFPTSYRVHIRSLVQRANHCTCPDFATNQLGTCKHIEAVLHRLGKRRDFPALQARPPARAYVFLDWEGDDAPVLRLHRGAETPVDLAPLLTEHFGADGRFLHRVPDDFLRLAERLRDHSAIDLGEDALGHARRLAEDAAQAQRAAAIAEQIRASAGRLPDLRARLYPYQVEGVAFLAGRGRALLADDMGLGKTLQAIAASWWLHRHDGVERVLVVCPASLKFQWAREIERFTGANAQVVQGPAADRGVQYRRGSGFYVVNYELLLRDLALINEVLCPDLLILDEAQRIKNWRTKSAAAVKRIGARYAFVLTGTPLENRLEDLYSLLQVIDARVLGPLWRYLVDFHITDERGKVLGYRNLSALRRRLAPVMLRRDRALVSDQLPERIVTRLDVPMSAKQFELHDEALSTAAQIAAIMRRRPLTPGEQNRMMAALQRARMACNAAGLVDKETLGAPKLDELATILEEVCRLSGLKAVVFSQWERMTELVEQRVRALGLGAVRLHGGVPSARRGALIDRFREDAATQVFISTDAGAVGLNLQNAAVLINLDIPWNPAVLEQRIARIHRLGQRQKVQAILLVAPASYEERVLALVEGKRHLFDNVVDADATEDVLSISRGLAEVLAADLANHDAPDGETGATAGAGDSAAGEPVGDVVGRAETEATALAPTSAGAPGASAAAAARTGVDEKATRDALVRARVGALQARFGERIERILAQGRGLLVVLDRVDAADDAASSVDSAVDSDEAVPVALVDRRTLAALNRLGADSPLAAATALPSSATPTEQPAKHRLARRAREHLSAARLLLQQGCTGTGLELLCSALLATAARRAGRDTSPTPAEAGIWVYAEALPTGALSAEQATLLLRALALAQGADAVPAALLEPLLAEAVDFIAVAS
ncbi:MAG: helicase [Chromatiaceae bacterium]|nr:MAG: helicase [Chromatiaceae bacterium]